MLILGLKGLTFLVYHVFSVDRKFEARWLIIGLDRRTFAHIFFVQKTLEAPHNVHALKLDKKSLNHLMAYYTSHLFLIALP